MTEPIKNSDCYYVCAAKLSGKTIEELLKTTGEMRISGGTDLDGIQSLFSQAGLGSDLRPCGSVAGVRAAVMSIPGGTKAFGVAFNRLDGSSHMIVAHRGPGGVAFRDYQTDNIGNDATADVHTGTSFWVVH